MTCQLHQSYINYRLKQVLRLRTHHGHPHQWCQLNLVCLGTTSRRWPNNDLSRFMSALWPAHAIRQTFYGSMILLLKAPRNLGKVRWCSKNIHLPKLRSDLKIWIIWSRKQYSQDKSLRGNSLQTTHRAHGTLVYRDADTGVFCERSIRMKSSKLTIPSPSSSMPGKIQ